MDNDDANLVTSIFNPGSLDPYDSYGLIACELARHLVRRNVHVNVVTWGKKQVEGQDSETAKAVSLPYMPHEGGIFLGYPTSYKVHEAYEYIRPRIALTMFESSKIPFGWAQILNDCEAVVVPSQFCKDSFKACGITSPIYAFPLGLGDSYVPIQRTLDGPLTFLAFLDRGKRKGWLIALRAFLRAFGDDPNFRLILKARDNKKHRMEVTNSNVEILQEDLTEQELAQLYGRCHVLLNPNLGEGFGLIPREFAATGGVSLATNWGGTADDIDLWGWGLDYKLVPAEWTGHVLLENQDLGVWAQPDEDHLVATMLEIAQFPETYLALAQSQAPVVRKLYSWENFASAIIELWTCLTS